MPSANNLLFAPWHEFYALLGSAAATLAGLLFVSITYGTGILPDNAEKAIRVWGDPTLGDFVQVLSISALTLFPVLEPWQLGIVLLVYDFFRCRLLFEVIQHFRTLHDLEIEDWRDLVISPGLLYLGLAYCGLALIWSWHWASQGLGIYCLLLLLLGIKNSWQQVIWMVLEKNKRGKIE